MFTDLFFTFCSFSTLCSACIKVFLENDMKHHKPIAKASILDILEGIFIQTTLAFWQVNFKTYSKWINVFALPVPPSHPAMQLPLFRNTTEDGDQSTFKGQTYLTEHIERQQCEAKVIHH